MSRRKTDLWDAPTNDLLLTADEVAQYLRLSKKHGERTVIRWAREEKLQSVRAGDLYRFRKRDVDAFLLARPRRK